MQFLLDSQAGTAWRESYELMKRPETYAAIREALRGAMEEYGIQESGAGEDQKLQKISDDLKMKDHKAEMDKLKVLPIFTNRTSHLIS